MSSVDVLVVGSGAREHALAWKIAQSNRLGKLYAAPGNPGIAALADCRPVRADDVAGITALACSLKVGLVVIGPEIPLAAGLADQLTAVGIPVFGPTAGAARIESSKSFARAVMSRAGVPQPEYAVFTDAEAALDYLNGLETGGIQASVVKANGLAAGKGAIVCQNPNAAREAVRALLVEASLGEAGSEVVIEECLVGEEISLFVLTDGKDAVPLLPAQDYKRACDGDKGLNTGGMGSYAPAPVLTPELLEAAMEQVIHPTLRGLAMEGVPFQGCLYAGLMKTAEGLKVIEFNCRFGDPETQVVLPLLESDLLELLLACAEKRLGKPVLNWRSGVAVTVVLASGGYPGPYETGKVISGLPSAAEMPGVAVFHAGTAAREGAILTAGGRVLSVTGLGPSFSVAQDQAYAALDKINFEGMHFRTDIANRVREDRVG